MEEAATEGCKANSHRGIQVVHCATEVELETFEWKANLQICRLDFGFISLISGNSIFLKVSIWPSQQQHLGESQSLECHCLLQMMADFSGWG